MGSEESERRRNPYTSPEIMGVLVDIQIKIARVETNTENIKEQVERHRHEVKGHIDKDEINFKAMGLEMTNLDNKIEAKHNFVMGIILPAMGGSAVVMFLLNWFHK